MQSLINEEEAPARKKSDNNYSLDNKVWQDFRKPSLINQSTFNEKQNKYLSLPQNALYVIVLKKLLTENQKGLSEMVLQKTHLEEKLKAQQQTIEELRSQLKDQQNEKRILMQ